MFLKLGIMLVLWSVALDCLTAGPEISAAPLNTTPLRGTNEKVKSTASTSTSQNVRAPSDEDAHSDSPQRLTKRTSKDKNSSSLLGVPGLALSSLVKPVDEFMKKAVGGLAFFLGCVDGVTTQVGMKTYNSLVEIQNSHIDNLESLRKATAKVGYSAVNLGSTVIEETGNVLDAFRNENDKVLKKTFGQIPVLRSVVSLANVIGLAHTQGIKNVANGVKNFGKLAVTAASLRKAKNIEEPTLLNGFLDMFDAGNLASLTANFGANGFAATDYLIGAEDVKDSFEKGNFYGKTSGPLKALKTALSGNVIF